MEEKYHWIIVDKAKGEYIFSGNLTVRNIAFAKKFKSKSAARDFMKKYSFENKNYKEILDDSELSDKMNFDHIYEKV